MTEQGVVISVGNEFAKVRIERNSACASCGKCGMTEKQKHVDFFAVNEVHAQDGDIVALDIPETNSAKLAMVGYILPLLPALGMLLVSLTFKWPDWASVLCFFGGLAVGFAIVAMIDRLRRHKWMESPRIVEIIRKNIGKDTPVSDAGSIENVQDIANNDQNK